MKYILSHSRLTASANVLARKLTELTNEEIRVFVDGDNRHECIIRYGNSAVIATDPNFNKRLHIRLAGNKRALSELLQEKEFPHVVFLRRTPEENEFPIVARDELNRGGGIGIRVIKSQEEYEEGNPVLDWTPWYNFKFELGVHILGGEIVKVFKKIREDGLDEEEYPIRNTHRGYRFSVRNNWETVYTGLKPFVKKLYEIVPIQFARLDVGYDKSSGGYRLIEINSAPDLTQNENTLNLYAQFLKERIF
jgi:hypothetical protein